MPIQVAPAQDEMAENPSPKLGALRPQPPLPGNGCCCRCCGAAPGPVDPARILADGGRYVQTSDGRVVEYFMFGSEQPDARVLLLINGSMGTGRMFGKLPGFVEALEQQAVRAVSISVAGYGYSSVNVKHKIGDWPRTDVEPVLAQEGLLESELMVEGASYGSAHAMAVAHHLGPKRVTKLHVIVPYIPIALREELGFARYMPDDALKCGPQYAESCRSCCLFCSCSCMLRCATKCPSCLADDHTKMVDKEVPGSFHIMNRDVVRSGAHAIHGWVYNGFSPTVSDNWGFDPRDIETPKIMVSYAEDDGQCDPAHGKFLGEWFAKKPGVQKCTVNVSTKEMKMGHDGFTAKMVSGAFVKELAEL